MGMLIKGLRKQRGLIINLTLEKTLWFWSLEHLITGLSAHSWLCQSVAIISNLLTDAVIYFNVHSKEEMQFPAKLYSWLLWGVSRRQNICNSRLPRGDDGMWWSSAAVKSIHEGIASFPNSLNRSIDSFTVLGCTYSAYITVVHYWGQAS